MIRLFPLFKTVGRKASQKSVDQLFSSFSDELFSLDKDLTDCAGSFKVDIKEDEKTFVLLAELPGYEQSDIQIEYQNKFLNITAQKNIKRELLTEDHFSYLRRERLYSKQSRSFMIEHINAEGMQASLENGILTLTIPKAFI